MAVGIDIEPFNMEVSSFEDNYSYYSLRQFAGRRLNFTGLELKNIEITHWTEFQDSFFDVIISHAVFEHIHNVPDAVKEIHRIMKPDSVAHIAVHLYTSISGSHHPLLLRDFPLKIIPDGIEPWFHLRGLPGMLDASLNKWREKQYKELFQDYFRILEWIDPPFEEGREYLSPQIREELRNYDEAELLKRYFIVIARKE